LHNPRTNAFARWYFCRYRSFRLHQLRPPISFEEFVALTIGVEGAFPSGPGIVTRHERLKPPSLLDHTA